MEEKQLLLDTAPGEGRKKFPTSLSSPHQSLASVSFGQTRERGGLGDTVSKCQPSGYTAGGDGVESTSGEQKIKNVISVSELGKLSH